MSITPGKQPLTLKKMRAYLKHARTQSAPSRGLYDAVLPLETWEWIDKEIAQLIAETKESKK